MTPISWPETTVLITGGTGSLGRALVRKLLTEYKPKGIRLFSRDEWKQWQMRQEIEILGGNVSYLIGDVRDAERVRRAMDGVNLVFHAAAMKQVPACEYNPLEAIKTNILGAQNVLNAALDARVERVMAVSSDKAVNPANLYGATKLCAEKLFTHGNVYAGPGPTKLSVCRYGNILNSRGSVVELFLKQKETGLLTLTDNRMSRFMTTLGHVTQFIIDRIEDMEGGEIYVPKMRSLYARDLAAVIAPDCETKEIGIRPGEKLHEILVTNLEIIDSNEYTTHYVIHPPFIFKSPGILEYTSIDNCAWWTAEDLKEAIFGTS